MTKERLEELIKQGATIYDKSGYSIDLSEKDSFMENILEFYYTIEDNRLLRMQKQPHMALNQWWIKELFETKDRAEWALKTVAERTERFEPPMWDDIQEDLEVIDYKFAFIKNNELYTFTVGKNGAIDISKLFIYSLGFHPIYTADPTKENYIKACEIVRNLFKGESNGKEVK